MLFVHGWCVDSTIWRYQRAHFEPAHRVVACDLRGHGRSKDLVEGLDVETAASDVAALLTGGARSPAVLVGHGMGNRVVLEAARLAPETVMSMVLIDGNRQYSGDPDLAVRHARDAYSATGFGPFRDKIIERMFRIEGDSAHRAEIMASAQRVPDSIAESYWDSIQHWDAGKVESAMNSLRVPLLVLQSTYVDNEFQRFNADPRMTSPWFDVIARFVPSARIQIIDSASHFSMLDAADAVNRCIETFLADATFRRFFESA